MIISSVTLQCPENITPNPKFKLNYYAGKKLKFFKETSMGKSRLLKR